MLPEDPARHGGCTVAAAMSAREHWERWTSQVCEDPRTGALLDWSSLGVEAGAFEAMLPRARAALSAMAALEGGAIANPDEGRMVGHYWLRAPELAPTPELKAEVEAALAEVKRVAAGVHDGSIAPPGGGRFTQVLLVGIGGSALGPQFVANALGSTDDRCAMLYCDNTDPDGIDRAVARAAAGDGLARTLTVVISKSGGTKETRNGMLEVEAAYRAAGLDFAAHAVAVTGEGSELGQRARRDGWRAILPMWDWVGGRTSVFSAVGLLPAALQGLDIDAMLAGAREMDISTREAEPLKNLAMAMALGWHHATGGRGARDMVVLPYRDRLELFSRYLQQLVMESLGKARDLDGAEVNQGIAVYGNKGSTDQHAFVQQLRDGVDNFFVCFIEALGDDDPARLEVDPGVTSGDYLHGFLEGTRRALSEGGRRSMSLILPRLDARAVGALIALWERAVGLYASLVNVNAYHQPGVEAGKKAAAEVLKLQARVMSALRDAPAQGLTPRALAESLDVDAGLVARLCAHLASTARHRVARVSGTGFLDASYRASA